MLQTLPLPTAKTYMFHWEKDNFGNIFNNTPFIHTCMLCHYLIMSILFLTDVLNNLLEQEPEDLVSNGQPLEELEVEFVDDEDDDEDDEEEKDEKGHGVVSASIIHDGYHGNHRVSTFSTISSTSKDSMFSTLSGASESYSPSLFSVASGVDSDYFDDSDEYISSSPGAEKCSTRSGKVSSRISQHFYRIFPKPKQPRTIYRAKSLCNSESKEPILGRETRSNSLPQQVKLYSSEPLHKQQTQSLRHVCFRRRPILSSDEDSKNITLRVVVFGADHVAGKVARAYSSLRMKESASPRLSRVFKLEFYFVPVKRDLALGHRRPSVPLVQTGSPKGATLSCVSWKNTDTGDTDTTFSFHFLTSPFMFSLHFSPSMS